jgi:very-short-patch-repair endonuclease
LFDTTLRQLLLMHPKGATSDQIIWRLRNVGVRMDASDLLHGLTRLSQQGEVIHAPSGRWILTEFTKPGTTGKTPNAKQGDKTLRSADDTLWACRARLLPSPFPGMDTTADETTSPLPEWSQLLEYFAATQRADPRGRIDEFENRHGQNWNLFQVTGHWWESAELRFWTAELPQTFTQALASRRTRSAALGWPVSIFYDELGRTLLPGLIHPVNWRFEGDELVLAVEIIAPALNPSWVKRICLNTSWREAALLEALFPEGEENDLGSISERMSRILATLGGQMLRPGELADQISTGTKGLRNAAAIFLPDDGAFTKGTADDLEKLKAWPRETRSRTALSALLDVQTDQNKTIKPALEQPALIGLSTLTASQREAADAALSGKVTVIQGPPGTGKSEVILSLLISAVAGGRTVLFSAKNHQAVNEVEQRLREVIGNSPLMTRASTPDGNTSVSFLDALGDIARSESWNAAKDQDPTTKIAAVLNRARQVAAIEDERRGLQQLNIEACDLAERLALFQADAPQTMKSSHERSSLFAMMMAALRRLFLRRGDNDKALPEFATQREIEARLTKLRDRIASESANLKPVEIEREIAADIEGLLPALAKRITTPDEADRAYIASRFKELDFEKKKASNLSIEDAMLVVRHRPIWAISTLSAPARIPLLPCLFDYVIFDEASQCDIASALPLMARARHAIVVGDPLQLRFVPGLGNATEHALMDAANLPKQGRANYAQSINSLFDFTENRPGAKRMFLADQFRSAPAIVDYLNADFYGGKLVNRREDDDFKPPASYKPGLTWEDVPGTVSTKADGNINGAEARHIAAQVLRLSEDKAFTGTVGVVSPFNAQVAEILKAIEAKIPKSACEKLSLRVATVDKWQGGQADVVFFSIVIAPGMAMSARTFLQKERRRLNVAISRARAVCIVVGDLTHAKSCGIRHIEFLARKATTPWSPPKLGSFDSQWERRLDVAMRARGLNPIPQFPVGTRYLDFAIEANGRKINVEVDGRRWHTDASGNRKVSDILRDREMRQRGWKVLRFWVHELAKDMEGCVDRIERELAAD